mgnify:CR=1 FL=1
MAEVWVVGPTPHPTPPHGTRSRPGAIRAIRAVQGRPGGRQGGVERGRGAPDYPPPLEGEGGRGHSSSTHIAPAFPPIPPKFAILD